MDATPCLHRDLLLKQVIQATQEEKRLIYVSHPHELLDVALFYDIKNKPKLELSQEEKFHLELYHEILEELCFTFNQQQEAFQYGGFSYSYFQKLESQLNLTLEILDAEIGNARYALQSWFHLQDFDRLCGGVFACASLPEENSMLDHALLQFVRIEESFLPAFIQGFKQARSKSLSKRLLLLLECASPKLKQACLEILLFRQDLEPRELLSLIEVYTLEKTTLQTQVLEGKTQDRSLYLKACQSLDPETARLGFETLGYLGLGQEIPFLIDSLKEDRNELTKQTIAEALQRITGAGITEILFDQPYDEEDLQTASPEILPLYLEANEVAIEKITRPSTQARDWENWWSGGIGIGARASKEMGLKNRFFEDVRYRYGRRLSFSVLIQVMENWELPSEERQQAWKELSLRSGQSGNGQSLPFQATAFVKLQIQQMAL